MVNLSRLFTLLAYAVESIKPIPSAANALASGSPALGRIDTSRLYPQDWWKTDVEKQTKALDVVSCYVESYSSPPIPNQTFPPYNEAIAKIYRYRQQRGVNLGSWFVHEKWMTPSLFTCAANPQVSEMDIASGWTDTNNARAVLEKHWDTFITAADLQYLASIGINTVRLPIGYWSLGPAFVQGTPYEGVAQAYKHSWARVVRAINQAADAGLGVLVDLHGAPGSQNGQQHSGVSDGKTNLFSDAGSQDKTIAVLTHLMQQLVRVNNVVGIQVLNEPTYISDLEPFYSRTIEAMRNVHPLAKKFPIYLHDGFDADRFSNYVATRQDFVVLDHHSYFVFTPSDSAEPGSQHTQDVKGPIAKDLANVSNRVRRNIIVGEWSCGLSSQSLENEADPEQVRRDFCTGQMNVYANNTAGWSFWAYKTEDCNSNPGWCFKKAVGTSLPSSFKPKSRRADITEHDDRTTAHWSMTNSLLYRFDAIHHRRSNIKVADLSTGKVGTESTTDPALLSFSQGYQDGATTAKQFADFRGSKVGFIDQYIKEALETAEPLLVAPGTEESYAQGFMRGLAEAEQP